MALRHDARTLRLEAEDRALHRFLDTATPTQIEAMNNALLWALVHTEVIQPIDPTHPHATIRQLRAAGFGAELHALSTLVRSKAWHKQHETVLKAIYRPLLKRAAGIP